jgi:hypothetical protein
MSNPQYTEQLAKEYKWMNLQLIDFIIGISVK